MKSNVELRVEELKLERDNIYFKMHCLYNAKTELYDRTLTDMRSRYDPTEAYIDVSRRVRELSTYNARMLYENCRRSIEAETKKPFSRDLWLQSVRSYYNLSAQGWINLYEYMVENGEYKGI